jgi:RNA polymerase sigma-70 factor (ECF subfamily)
MKFASKDEKRVEFIKVIDQNRGIIYKVVNAYTNDPEDQKDLVQEVIVQLWSSFDKYDPKYKMTTWMYRIALNVSISYYRKAVARKKHAISLDVDIIEIKTVDENEHEEEIKLLHQFIQHLDELNRGLMILYLDGNNHVEIAEILNITVSNVGTKINRIKEKLKKQFNQV